MKKLCGLAVAVVVVALLGGCGEAQLVEEGDVLFVGRSVLAEEDRVAFLLPNGLSTGQQFFFSQDLPQSLPPGAPVPNSVAYVAFTATADLLAGAVVLYPTSPGFQSFGGGYGGGFDDAPTTSLEVFDQDVGFTNVVLRVRFDGGPPYPELTLSLDTSDYFSLIFNGDTSLTGNDLLSKYVDDGNWVEQAQSFGDSTLLNLGSAPSSSPSQLVQQGDVLMIGRNGCTSSAFAYVAFMFPNGLSAGQQFFFSEDLPPFQDYVAFTASEDFEPGAVVAYRFSGGFQVFGNGYGIRSVLYVYDQPVASANGLLTAVFEGTHPSNGGLIVNLGSGSDFCFSFNGDFSLTGAAFLTQYLDVNNWRFQDLGYSGATLVNLPVSQSSLNPGDVAVIGFNDISGNFALVAINSFPLGASFTVVAAGLAGSASSSEYPTFGTLYGVATFTAASTIPAGTTFLFKSGIQVLPQWNVIEGFDPSRSDTFRFGLHLVTGPLDNPSFLFSISRSQLQTVIEAPISAKLMLSGTLTGRRYGGDGTVSGSALLALIVSPGLWESSDDTASESSYRDETLLTLGKPPLGSPADKLAICGVNFESNEVAVLAIDGMSAGQGFFLQSERNANTVSFAAPSNIAPGTILLYRGLEANGFTHVDTFQGSLFDDGATNVLKLFQGLIDVPTYSVSFNVNGVPGARFFFSAPLTALLWAGDPAQATVTGAFRQDDFYQVNGGGFREEELLTLGGLPQLSKSDVAVTAVSNRGAGCDLAFTFLRPIQANEQFFFTGCDLDTWFFKASVSIPIKAVVVFLQTEENGFGRASSLAFVDSPSPRDVFVHSNAGPEVLFRVDLVCQVNCFSSQSPPVLRLSDDSLGNYVAVRWGGDPTGTLTTSRFTEPDFWEVYNDNLPNVLLTTLGQTNSIEPGDVAVVGVNERDGSSNTPASVAFVAINELLPGTRFLVQTTGTNGRTSFTAYALVPAKTVFLYQGVEDAGFRHEEGTGVTTIRDAELRVERDFFSGLTRSSEPIFIHVGPDDSGSSPYTPPFGFNDLVILRQLGLQGENTRFNGDGSLSGSALLTEIKDPFTWVARGGEPISESTLLTLGQIPVTVSPGDVAIVGIGGSKVAVVTISQLQAGDRFFLTDRDVANSKDICCGGRKVMFEAPMVIPPKTVLLYDGTETGGWFNVDGLALELDFNGERLYLYSGSEDVPNFLFAMAYDDRSLSTSTTPTGLAAVLNVPSDRSNLRWVGDGSLTGAALLSAISDDSLWTWRSDPYPSSELLVLGRPESSLVPGDLAIVGFNSDNDHVAVLVVNGLETGETFKITTKIYDAQTDGFETSGATISFTASSPIPADTILLYEGFQQQNGFRHDDFVALEFSTSRDRLSIFEGVESSPNFLFGLRFDTCNPNCSPPEAPQGLGALLSLFRDNGRFNGNGALQHEALFNAVLDRSNWLERTFVFSDAELLTLGDGTTRMPTASPTTSPTKNPTNSPTSSPTRSPTEKPTQAPTEAPTPTAPTTDAPTDAPTLMPTTSPTPAPTPAPTAFTSTPAFFGISGAAGVVTIGLSALAFFAARRRHRRNLERKHALVVTAAGAGKLQKYIQVSRGVRSAMLTDALLEAASAGHTEIVSEIIHHQGVSVNVADAHGVVALMAAAGGGQLQTVHWLIEHEADPTARDEDGHTASWYAAETNDIEVWLATAGLSMLLPKCQANHIDTVAELRTFPVKEILQMFEIPRGGAARELVFQLGEIGFNIEVMTFLRTAGLEAYLDTALDEFDALSTDFTQMDAEVVSDILQVTAVGDKAKLKVALAKFRAEASRKAELGTVVPQDQVIVPMAIPTSTAATFRYSAFLSHNWGDDALGRDNHARVARINEGLKALGLRTWFDSNQLEGNIAAQLARGIDNSAVVLVFVTKRYQAKLEGDSDDNCKREFQYAVQRRTTQNIIPVVLEPGMLDTKSWSGPLQLELGAHLYVDMHEDDNFSQSVRELYNRVVSRLSAINTST